MPTNPFEKTQLLQQPVQMQQSSTVTLIEYELLVMFDHYPNCVLLSPAVYQGDGQREEDALAAVCHRYLSPACRRLC